MVPPALLAVGRPEHRVQEPVARCDHPPARRTPDACVVNEVLGEGSTDATRQASVEASPGSCVLLAQPVAVLMGAPASQSLDIGAEGAAGIVLEYDTEIR